MFQPETLEENARQNMPVSRRWAYFDHAAVAPLPLPTQAAMQDWLREAMEEGDTCWPSWAKKVEELRTHAAQLLHANSDEIALIPNTSTGISSIAEGLPWEEGDNVVFPDDEFPSNALPWQNLASRGIEPRRVSIWKEGEFSLDAMSRAIDGRTRLISMSWVGFSNGFRIPLDQVCELASQKKVLFLLDAIQGLGVFPLDLSRYPIDFVAADGHKWMLGPEGAGILYIRRKHLDRIRPSITGWGSVAQSWKFSAQELNWKPNAARFEAGSANMIGLVGLNASLKMLLSWNCHQPNNIVAQRVLANVELIADSLRKLGAQFRLPPWEARSGILSFRFQDRDPDEIRRRLLDSGVVLSVRHGMLRASTHVYNNQSDIDRLIGSIDLKK